VALDGHAVSGREGRHGPHARCHAVELLFGVRKLHRLGHGSPRYGPRP